MASRGMSKGTRWRLQSGCSWRRGGRRRRSGGLRRWVVCGEVGCLKEEEEKGGVCLRVAVLRLLG